MKKYRNVAYIIAEFFNIYDEETKRSAIKYFDECFILIPEEYKETIRNILMESNNIDEFVYIEEGATL
ncbi:hypothetical protein [Anaerosinus sp.]|uniref:hypothetical protein n=1 Tax=Selenobaculum sp. TaxID=3074374 RepID=UPI003AB446C8